MFDRVSDKDIIEYTLGGGIDRVSLVSFSPGSLPIRPRFADAFHQISDIAEGLRYLHSQNVVHGRLRGVSRHLPPQRGPELTASGRGPFSSTMMVEPR